MSTSLFDGTRLEIEYDEKFAAQKLTDVREGITLYGDTPAECLKTFTFVQWCHQAALCYRFCILCGMPMDPPKDTHDTHPDWRFPVCAAMESVLANSQYWQNLPKDRYSQAD